MRRSIPAGSQFENRGAREFRRSRGAARIPSRGPGAADFANHGVQLWRGHVKYAEPRHVSFWARVEVSVQFQAVVAGAIFRQRRHHCKLRCESKTRTGAARTRNTRLRGSKTCRDECLDAPLKAGSVFPIAILVEASRRPAWRSGYGRGPERRRAPVVRGHRRRARRAKATWSSCEIRPMENFSARDSTPERERSVVITERGQTTMKRVSRIVHRALRFSLCALSPGAAADKKRNRRRRPSNRMLDQYISQRAGRPRPGSRRRIARIDLVPCARA